MANIRENTKNGKVVSYRFTVCLERDTQGKQLVIPLAALHIIGWLGGLLH